MAGWQLSEQFYDGMLDQADVDSMFPTFSPTQTARHNKSLLDQIDPPTENSGQINDDAVLNSFLADIDAVGWRTEGDKTPSDWVLTQWPITPPLMNSQPQTNSTPLDSSRSKIEQNSSTDLLTIETLLVTTGGHSTSSIDIFGLETIEADEINSKNEDENSISIVEKKEKKKSQTRKASTKDNPCQFKCGIDGCGKMFKRESDLRRHQDGKMHGKKPIFFCGVLGCARAEGGFEDGFFRKDKRDEHEVRKHTQFKRRNASEAASSFGIEPHNFLLSDRDGSADRPDSLEPLSGSEIKEMETGESVNLTNAGVFQQDIDMAKRIIELEKIVQRQKRTIDFLLEKSE